MSHAQQEAWERTLGNLEPGKDITIIQSPELLAALNSETMKGTHYHEKIGERHVRIARLNPTPVQFTPKEPIEHAIDTAAENVLGITNTEATECKCRAAAHRENDRATLLPKLASEGERWFLDTTNQPQGTMRFRGNTNLGWFDKHGKQLDYSGISLGMCEALLGPALRELTPAEISDIKARECVEAFKPLGEVGRVERPYRDLHAIADELEANCNKLVALAREVARAGHYSLKERVRGAAQIVGEDVTLLSEAIERAVERDAERVGKRSEAENG